jgi:hypothetical protein
MGETQGKEGRFNHRPQENDVTIQPQEDSCRSKSTVGEVAEGTKEGITQFRQEPMVNP